MGATEGIGDGPVWVARTGGAAAATASARPRMTVRRRMRIM
jgi:hypothetical protein